MKRLHLVLLTLAAVALAFAVLVATFYEVENRRGARAWNEAKHELAAQGESLDAADFIPPPVPDEQNLALIPLFARALDYQVDPQKGGLFFGPKHREDKTIFRDMPYGPGGRKPPGIAPGGWAAGQPLAMDVLQRYYAKEDGFPHPPLPGTPSGDVLLALTKFAPAIEEFETATTRPRARFPVCWTRWPPSTIELPQDNLIQKLTGVLRLRALAHLDAGQHAEAMRDLSTAWRVRDMIRPEPTLVAHLVTITCDGMLLQPVWEGLAARRWTADELRDIQLNLRADDRLADYVRALRSERAVFFCPWLDGLRAAGDTRELGPLWDDSDKTAKETYRRMAAFYPRGWIDQNEAGVCLEYQEILTRIVDLPARRVSAARVKARQQARESERSRFVPAEILSKVVMPVMGSVLSRVARAQTANEQAEVACALERYFLANQAYPQTLEALVPGFIDRVPNDLIAGGPMRYRRTDEGRYLLYGIGWDERDDGGTIVWLRPTAGVETAGLDRENGDWVWQYRPVDLPVR